MKIKLDQKSLLRNSLKNPTRYLLKREIGKGGMGVVYEAFDFELRRKVAVKLILKKRLEEKSDFEIDKHVRELRKEARFAATLQHSNIVSVHRFIILDDSWETVISLGDGVDLEGAPVACIVMQFIDGHHLAELIGESRDPGVKLVEGVERTAIGFFGSEQFSQAVVSTRAINEEGTDREDPKRGLKKDLPPAFHDRDYITRVARVGEQLSSALSHAHAANILHNDIKPQNVMVDEGGNAWLTDFGVASNSNSKLGAGGTRAYMAPEAQEGNQSERSDVFSLGATIYRMLASVVPESRKNSEPSLAKINSSVPVDLAAIVEKAIQFKPGNRYTTAAELQNDLNAFLNGHSVSANPAGSLGQLRRWAMRNQVAAAFATLLFAVSIIGFVVSAWQAHRANTNAGLAKQSETESATSAARSSDILSIVKDSFESVDPAWGADAKTPASVVLVVALKKAKESALDDEGMSELLETITTSLIGIGEYELAIEAATELVEVRGRNEGIDSLEHLHAMGLLANANDLAGNLETGLEMFQRCHDKLEEDLDENDPKVIMALSALATSNFKNGNLETAFRQADQVVALQADFLPEILDRLSVLSNSAVIFSTSGKYERAINILNDARDESTDELGEDDPMTLRIYSNLVDTLKTSGKTEDVVEMNREIFNLRKGRLGERHPETLESMVNLSTTMSDEGDFDEAIPLQLECMKLVLDELGEKHPLAMVLMNNLAGSFLSKGQVDKAIEQFEAVCRVRSDQLGPRHPDTLISKYNLAATYDRVGQYDKAIPLFKETLAARTEILKKDHPHIPNMMNRLAVTYWKTKQFDKAVDLYEKTVALTEETLGVDHPDTLYFAANLGVNYVANGQLDEGIKSLERACEARKTDPSLVPYRKPLKDAYLKAKKSDKFAAFVAEDIEQLRGKLKADPVKLSQVLLKAGKQLIEANAFSDSKKYLLESLAIRKKETPKAWETFETMSVLGESFFYLDDFDAAKPLVTEADAGLIQSQATIPESLGKSVLANSSRRKELVENREN